MENKKLFLEEFRIARNANGHENSFLFNVALWKAIELVSLKKLKAG